MLFVVAAYKGNDWSNYNFNLKILEEVVRERLGDSFPDFATMGITSLLLTIANVIMVAIGATLMMRLKEVLPVEKKVFWDDLKTARRIYQGRAIDSITGEALSVDEVSVYVLFYFFSILNQFT